MAAQSKLSSRQDRTVRGIIADLTKLYLSNRTRISRLVWVTLFLALVNRVRHAVSEQKAASAREAEKRAARRGTRSTDGDGGGRRKVELDREFFRSLLRLLRVVVPSWRSKETRLLISHSFFLVVRTLISLKVAAMDGAIVKSLVKGNGREFLVRIVWWMLIAVPATFTNSMVRASGVGRWDRLTSAAIVPPGRAVAEIPDETYAAHPRQVPLETDLLRHIGSRRQDKKRGPAHHGGRGQVFQQSGRAIQ
jgi:hypothetical protein